MGSIWNHLARPLSYRDSTGELRYLSTQDIARVKNYVVCVLAAMVVKVVFSSKSLKSKVLSSGLGTATVFYFVTAFFKMRGKGASDLLNKNTDSPGPLKRCSDFESFGVAKREIGLQALAEDLASEQDRREDDLRQAKWTPFRIIIEDQKRDDQL